MYLGGLHNGTSRGGKPAETRCHIQFTYRPRVFITFANPFHRADMFFYFDYIEPGIKGVQAVFVQLIPGLQEFELWAVHYHADVQKFLTFNPRHYADNGILK